LKSSLISAVVRSRTFIARLSVPRKSQIRPAATHRENPRLERPQRHVTVFPTPDLNRSMEIYIELNSIQ
jgi:hypothetical protein